MIALISPAKSLDFTPSKVEQYSEPAFINKSEQVMKSLKKLSQKKIKELMKLSDDLASLNHERYQQWSTAIDPVTSKQAVLAFTGDVYLGMENTSLEEQHLAYAQKHLRILSGLYGFLKPLDMIKPYRLEMGTKHPVGKAKNLYEFWKPVLAPSLLVQLKEVSEKPVIINLASNEYFKAVDKKALKDVRIITPNFKDNKEGVYKMIGFFAKRARGMMVRYMMDHQITEPEQLKSFDTGGYIFNHELSTQDDWVFTRG